MLFASLLTLFLVLRNDTVVGEDVCDGAEAKPRSGKRSTVFETEMAGNTETHELTE